MALWGVIADHDHLADINLPTELIQQFKLLELTGEHIEDAGKDATHLCLCTYDEVGIEFTLTRHWLGYCSPRIRVTSKPTQGGQAIR